MPLNPTWNQTDNQGTYFGKQLALAGRVVACVSSGMDEMDSICFDKLINFIARFWDSAIIYGLASFRFPGIEITGKHGPGRAVNRNKNNQQKSFPYIYFCELISILDKNWPPDYRWLIYSEPDRITGLCKVRSTINAAEASSRTLSDEYLPELDRECVNFMKRVLSSIPTDELRAVGTHCNPIQTQQALKEVFHGYRTNALRALDDSGSLTIENVYDRFALTQESWEYTEEIMRKTRRNPNLYQNAYERSWDHEDLKNEDSIQDRMRRELLLAIQRPASEIWTDTAIQYYTDLGDDAHHRAGYIRGLLLTCRCQVMKQVRLSDIDDRIMQKAMTAREQLVKKGFSTLPKIGTNSVSKITIDVLSDVRNQLFPRMPGDRLHIKDEEQLRFFEQ